MDDSFTTANPHPVKAKEEIIEIQDPLTLGESEDTLVTITNDHVQHSKGFFTKVKLKDRQDRNFAFLMGREDLGDKNLYRKRVYQDNILYETESTLKPLATSKDPDILIYPGDETKEAEESADQLTRALQVAINTRELKEIKAIAFKHMPVYFIAAVRYFWNPEKGKNGDIDWVVVHPQNLVLDNNAKTKDIKKHEFIGEYVEVTVQELIMRFPNKEEEIWNELVTTKKIGVDQKGSPGALATTLKVLMFWFNYYEKKQQGWTKINAVLWKYNNIIFKAQKNPNWDWNGETHFFNYDDEIQPQELMSAMENKQIMPGFNEKQVYYNYFEQPEFPYILIGYDQWGTMVYDETSRIEQLIRLQQSINDRGNQVKRMLDRAMGKHVFSTKAQLKAEDIEEMNWEDMDQAIIVDGNVNETHAFVNADQPSAQMINDYANTRAMVFQKQHVNAVSGTLQSNTATSNQIAREANFTYADDLVDATINDMSEKMARAIMQLIKLRYTEEHFVRLIGKQGEVVFQRLHRDMIQDGMEVTITASGVDKIQRQSQAMDMARLQLIDPLSFYEDIGAKNAQERTKRLWFFLNSPEQYFLEYVEGGVDQAAAKLNGTGGGGQQAMMDIAQIQQGQMPQVPQQVDQEYANAIAQFMQSPEFSQLDPTIQQQALEFAKQVQAALAQVEGQQFNAPTQFGRPSTSAASIAPTENPSPENTANIPVNPPTGVEASPTQQ